jgi:hypothetical protein
MKLLKKVSVLFLTLSALSFQWLILPGHAEEARGWGPGHGMMWAGPTRDWFGWGMSAHFCGDDGKKNIKHFIALIDKTITPTATQKLKEYELMTAFEKAQEDLVSLCEKPHEGAWSPIERLTVAEAHLTAMITAIHSIKPSLEAFYATLTDEQKKKIDGLKPDWRMRLNWMK